MCNCANSKYHLFSSLSGSYTLEDKDESTGESGYSDVESTSATDLSEVDDSYSAAAEVPEKQTSAKVKPKRPKDAATKDLIKSSKEPALGSSLQTIAPGTKTARKIKLKQVEKKGMHSKDFSYKTDCEAHTILNRRHCNKKFGNQWSFRRIGTCQSSLVW